MFSAILLACVVTGASTFPVVEICQGPGCPNGGFPLRGFQIEAPAQPVCSLSIIDSSGSCIDQDSSCGFLGGVDLGGGRTGWDYQPCEVPGAAGACDVELSEGSIMIVNWN